MIHFEQMGKTLFLTKTRSIFLLRKVLLPLIILHLSWSVIATVRNFSLKSPTCAAVLISDYAFTKYDYWISPLAIIGAYPYWTYYFNNRGMKVKWIPHAYSRDLEKVIKDPRFQSIVVVGHGSVNAWQAIDALITNKEMAEITKGLEKKKGEWIQLTCAEEDQWPTKMGELVMNKENVYTYNSSVNTFILVADAISGFKYLKSIQKESR